MNCRGRSGRWPRHQRHCQWLRLLIPRENYSGPSPGTANPVDQSGHRIDELLDEYELWYIFWSIFLNVLVLACYISLWLQQLRNKIFKVPGDHRYHDTSTNTNISPTYVLFITAISLVFFEFSRWFLQGFSKVSPGFLQGVLTSAHFIIITILEDYVRKGIYRKYKGNS